MAGLPALLSGLLGTTGADSARFFLRIHSSGNHSTITILKVLVLVE
ncbi:MAG: hypothetical protein JPMHGGIA_01063 [Saprospiraceae bacterium]|jgi:hypothetical protein|nr:hypothetical protein [Saprospiraceae bacterium]